MNLEGSVHNIIYQDEESNFVVFRLEAKGHADLVVATGTIPGLNEGTEVFLAGDWQRHPKHGKQFTVEKCRQILPSSSAGIKKYLSSGMVKGIGKTYAARLVEAFGDKTLDVIEQEPDRLREVEGIGPKRAKTIIEAWGEQRSVREVMLFLHDCGLGGAFAWKIFRKYRQQAPIIIREDPYRLALEIFGIGFRTADKIAKKIGVPPDSMERAAAGLAHVLTEASSDGHVFLPKDELLTKAEEFLEVSEEVLLRGLERLIEKHHVIVDDSSGVPRVYTTALLRHEATIARELDRMQAHERHLREFDHGQAVAWAEKERNITLAERQKEAVHCALDHKIMVLTGGPGTGKTTIVRCILMVFRALKARVRLAAPTGRAARRLSETCRQEAFTIHRLLKYEPGASGFAYNRDNKLKVDLLIVDESSMVDTALMSQLLQALPSSASLILVGDVNQLPSVGPGSVLGDLIASKKLPVVALDEVFRQAKRSLIVQNAHRINEGIYPIAPKSTEKTFDFYFIHQDDNEKALGMILTMAQNRIPERFKIPPEEIQVLTPMNRGSLGTQNLNAQLQMRINPQGAEIRRGPITYRHGDRVMQVRNNYDKEVSNGDIGLITALDPEEKTLTVSFDGTPVSYEYSELDELTLAYAVSIHKSQGSEFRAVIIPVSTQHFVMLQRNLMYTAVTRAKKLVVLVGSSKAMHLALKRADAGERHTSLIDRMRQRDWEVFLGKIREQEELL